MQSHDPLDSPRSADVGRLERRVRDLERDLDARTTERDRLQAIVEAAPLAIYFKDAQHSYVLVNREYERLAGRLRADILGRHDFELFPPPVAQLFRDQDEEVATRDEVVEFRETIPLPDGVHSFITSKFPLRSATGTQLGVAGVCTEITALERAQAQLEQAQADLMKRERLAMLGEMSAVIAHEVRNPLGVMFNSLASLQRLVPPDPQCEVLLGIIGEEADRLNRMVAALLELARPTAARLEPTRIDALARGAVATTRTLTAPEAEVRLEVPAAAPTALVDERLLRQALVNLVSNALQTPQRKLPVRVRIEADDDELRVAVIDDGPGVAPDLAERIFAPFFTTRPSGTGLGLAVVRLAAEAHGGSVSVQTTPGGGATFVLRLPHAPEAERREPGAGASEPTRRSPGGQ